jgi:Flp pilus assembly protein TadD
MPALLVAAAMSLSGCGGRSSSPRVAKHSDDGIVTFTRDIAPITYAHCVACHRAGESGPFELITYDDVASHATQIAQVTESRYMPPWLPDEGSHRLAQARRLTDTQVATIRSWVAAGKPEGEPSDLPALPQFAAGWQLGQPDLVVRMPQTYELPSEGVDVYRNFVVPIPINVPRWVRAMELRPDNRRLVHHAFMLIDRDGECRRQDAADEQPGFEGMEAEGAESPDGHFISWQPGKVTTPAPEGMAWLLTPGTDLVLQMHMQPTGKPEQVQAAVGFFFTDQPPVRFPLKLALRSTEIDIPAGDANYQFETRYTLPTDVQLYGIIPHAHYLGKQLEALAVLPDGRTDTLLRISNWDFNWQGDYQFADPPRLPRGTTLVQRFTYDNSAANPRNPHSPPKRVRYGLQSVDEMGELWLQVVPLSAAGRDALLRDYGRRTLLEIAANSRRRLQTTPHDVKALVELGKVTLALESPQAALPILRRAVELDPESVAANYFLGHALMIGKDFVSAQAHFERVRRLDATFPMAWHDQGLIYLDRGQLPAAEAMFRRSLELSAYHDTTLSNLGLVLLKQNRLPEGIEMLQRALLMRPHDARLRALLQQARQVLKGEG